MTHLGGPETEALLLERDARYVGLTNAGDASMFRIVSEDRQRRLERDLP